MEPRSVLDLDEIDLSDLAFWERPWAEREGAFRLLRQQRPLAFFEEPDVSESSPLAPPPGPGYRAVTRHADVTEISRHPEIYCSGQGAVSVLDLPEEMIEYFAGMISTDNPRHARLRRIVSAAFNPRRVKEIEQSIEEVADKVIDRVAGLGGCDFVTEIAAPMPLEIICDMMGIPPSEYAAVLRCSNIILSNGDPEYVPEGSDPVLAFIEAGQELTALMTELSAHRVDHPTDDLTSALITTNIDGEALTHAELASFFILLLTAGNETTRTAIAHGLLVLTEHPDQRALWQSDPTGIAATGVDEIVRWASPVIWMRRTVVEDTVLSGRSSTPGTRCSSSTTRPTGTSRSSTSRTASTSGATQPPSRVRRGRTTLLPGGPSGPARGGRDAPPALDPAPRHRGLGGTRPSAVELHQRHQASPLSVRCRAEPAVRAWPP